MENIESNNKKGRRITFLLIGVMFLTSIAIPISGLSLNDLDDVIITPPLYNEQHLTYDSGLANWTNSNFTGGTFIYSNWFNQKLNTTDSPTFATINTGQGANELYAMNQNVRTTDDVTFNSVNATLFGDGGNLTNITAIGDGYSGDTGHPHNQDLNTSSNVQFNDVTAHYFIGDGTQLTFNFVGARAYKSTLQSIPSGSYIKILFQTENYDSGNNYDNIIGMRYTIPENGYYTIGYSINIESMPDGSKISAYIHVNGNPIGGFNEETISTATSTSGNICSTDIFYLYQYQYVEIYAYQNSGSNKNIIGASGQINYMYVTKADIN